MSVCRFVCSSDVILREESERKWTISDHEEIALLYEPRGSCLKGKEAVPLLFVGLFVCSVIF